MPDKFQSSVENAARVFDKLKSDVATLRDKAKNVSGNYEAAVSMFYASTDHIKELEQKVKSGSDPKAPEELNKWKGNHPQIAARVKPIFDKVVQLKEGAMQTKNSGLTLQKTLEDLTRQAPRSVKEKLQETLANLKSLTQDTKVLITSATKVFENLNALPKCPAV